MSKMGLPAFRRPVLDTLSDRLDESRRFIQAVIGPRQVGKTTLVRQALESVGVASHYASADEPAPRDEVWLQTQWERARAAARSGKGAVLVLDEAQKVLRWSEVVKRLWDEDTAEGLNLKVVLLGSAPLLMQKGLTESLAGRFEVLRATHWSFSEMRDAFGWDYERYLYFGGYPGGAALASDPERWRRYVLDSLVETTIARDILMQARVDKPALLRQLFQLGCDYSGQILSFHKMLGQLHGAGNTVTLAHYLQLLSAAGMLAGLQKYSGSRVRQRGSSPKLLVQNTALMTSASGLDPAAARADQALWGRLVESAVGAHLLNATTGSDISLYYWRVGQHEVDFILKGRGRVVALEVTSARSKDSLSGMERFSEEYRPHRRYLIGGQGVPLEEFLVSPPERWLA